MPAVKAGTTFHHPVGRKDCHAADIAPSRISEILPQMAVMQPVGARFSGHLPIPKLVHVLVPIAVHGQVSFDSM
jgi:hypothetical protein